MHQLPNHVHKAIVLLGCLILSCFSAQAQVAVPFSPRLQNGNLKVKGDIIFVGNNIVNRASASNPSEANTPYDGPLANDRFNMEYIDIDGDPSTFSSSSADLTLTGTCSKIVYAGLYWASAYPFERSTNSNSSWQGTPRLNDWNQVKFKLPGGAYINLTADNNADPAGDEDAIIFDGYNASNIPASFDNAPIVCYKNVTDLVRGLANPNGTYTLANLRAAKGRRIGGSSAGWVMVIIYENPTMPAKFISTFDGYVGVQGNVTADINVNGFVTLPPPFPVRAKLGVGALEGDFEITGDRLRIKANSLATFTDVSNTLNPANNFFNSSITNNNAQVPSRNPYGTNTLGLDLDMLNLSNPLNGILPNNETGATLRMITSGDTYGTFLASFAVEVIEPEIKLVKTVRDISGNDIGGADVTLGQVLDYVVTFQNIGNDDAQNLTIRDILPENTFFNSIDLSGTPGVTYVYNPTTRQVTFTIPNSLVEIGDPVYTIKIRVQVVNTCSELTNACSNIIQNQAYTTYRGVLNANVISDDPSVAGLDSCGLGIPGPANFLVDIDECSFRRTEILCGTSVVLTAGSGYASYQWHNASGAVIGNTQSITVTTPGEYYVINTPTPPCIGITEYITVTRFGTNQTNPVLPFADEIVTCPNDGEELPNIFLCGLNDNRLIQTNITNAVSIIWEKLNEASCPAVGIDNCPNKNPLCSWTQEGTGTNFNATLAGQYRVVINYQNGCFNRYYFNVYTNLLDAQHIVQNITCNTAGKITVTNVPSTYEFQLVNQNTGAVLVPYQNNPVFPIAVAGSYLVQIRQQGVTDGCVFSIPDIGVSDLDFQVNVITKNTSCNGFGSIRLQALNVRPQYYYSISGPSTLNVGPLTDNDYVFQNLNPGTYTVTVRTDDGCTFTSNTTILDNSNLSLNATILQNISCVPGSIKLTPSGGEAPYVYAIYSINGTLQNPTAGDYTGIDTFEIPIGQQGTYVFIMVDNNNCTALSNPVTIQNLPDVVFTTSFENIKCNGANNGSITYTVTNANGFSYSFELVDASGTVIQTNTSGVFNGLAPGNYMVNFIQNNATGSCEFPANFTLTQPAPLTGAVTQTQPYNCITNGATISITAGSVTGGTPPYQYSIDGINFGNATSFGGLTAGTYTVTVRDANNCTFSTNAITVNPLSPPTNIQFAATAPTCPALTSNVTLTVTGGTGPFVYEITAPAAAVANNGNNAVFSGLAPGTYTFKVTDANGCSFNRNYTINQVTPIAVTGQPVSNVICFGAANGSASYTVSGFGTTYNYIVRNGSGTTITSGTNTSTTTISANNLPAGTYTITVTDTATNCTATANVTIDGPAIALDLTPAVSSITCVGAGSVSAPAVGGWGSYQYQLVLPNGTTVGPQSSAVFNNLTLAGTYSISVRDANNCTVTKTFTLSTVTSPALSINASSDLCYDTTNSATITVAVTGGLAPFSYTINGSGNQASATFANLTPGTYTIEVTDANGCTDSVTQIIGQQLTAVSVLGKNLDCTSSPDAEIDITIGGGRAPYSYQTSINGGTYGTPTPVVGSVINYTTAAPGTYQFQITDNIGCVIQTNVITITPLTNPSILSVTQTQNILCNGDNSGAIAIAIDNTVGVAPITISVVNTTTGTNFGSQTSGLPAGNYTITITDSNSCTDTETITLSQPDPITYNVATVDITCNNPGGTSYGEIIVQNVLGGTGPFTYHVSNNFGYSDIYNATARENHSFQILAFGIYQVDVIDANGCSVVRQNIIIASPPDDLVIDVSAVTADCLNGGTATITVTSAVSSGNFQFAILEYNTIPYSNNYQPADPGTPETTTFTGLTPGVTYTFVVYDVVTQCYYFKSANLPIDSPSNLTATLDVVSNVSCTGSGNGNVSFTFSNYDSGASRVDYEIFNAQSNTTTGITGSSTGLPGGPVTVSNFGTLPPGNYYILFTEVGGAFAGCTNASAIFSISQSTNLLQVSATVTKNDNCNNNAGQITATGQYGTTPYQYQLVAAGDPAPTVATWTGTSVNVFNTEGGNYTVYIKDANNCIQSAPITLPTDTTPVITAAVTNQCSTAEGSFTIQVDRTVNGIAPYTYSINGATFQTQAAASFTYDNLSSGSYTIQIKDANGCGNTVTLQIYAPLNLTPVATLQPSCANNDGEITVTPFGGSGNYEYELQNGAGTTIVASQALSNFTGLAAGNYIVVIHDTTSNCNEQAAISLEVPTPVNFSASSGNVSCNGGSDGAITITLPTSNDNPPYTYSVNDGVNPAITQNTPVFTGLPAGTYTVTVTSGKNCSDTETVIITEPSLLDISATATAFACNASNTVTTSTITVTVENDGTGNPSGTAPYSYSIDGTNFFPTPTFDIVDNGSTQNINVTVKDSNNCTQTTTVTINPLPEITAVAAVRGTAITCTNDETVQITVTGGSGDFTFDVLPLGSQPSVTPGPGNNTATLTLTQPGSYTFQITDNVTGCYMLSVPYEILPFDTIEVIASNPTPVTCFGDSDGSLTINVTGYTGAYSYDVVNAAGTTVATGNGNTVVNPHTINGLSAGNLHVVITATDTPFCTDDSNTVTVTSPDSPLQLTANQTASVTCDNNQGEIIASATGGWGTYLYELVNNTTSTTIQAYAANSTFTGLAAGNYTVSVRDSGGCIVNQTVVLVQPALISATINSSVTQVLCHGDNTAMIEALTVTGGQGSYQFILNQYDAAGTTIVLSSGPQTSPQFLGLGAGIYSITITDGWNCGLTTPTLTITEPTPVQGFLSANSNMTCLTQAEIVVSGSGGTPPYQFSADGISYSNTSVYTVGPGTYQYYVRDANGCQAVLTNQITILPVPALQLNLDLSSASINCSGESTAAITANATGGLGSYMYELLDGSSNVLAGPQATNSFTGLPAGNYYVRVVSLDCRETSSVINIIDPAQLTVSYIKQDVLCFGDANGSIEIHTTGGTGIIQYAISPNLNQFVTDNLFDALPPGSYEVIVQDQKGCFELLNIDILEPAPLIATVDAVNPELCLHDADGSISINITGGTGNYLVSLDNVTFVPVVGNQHTFTNLVGDTLYLIYVRDSNGCNVNPPVEQYMDPAVEVIPAVSVQPNCTNNVPGNTVTVSVNVEVVSQVQYSLDGVTYVASNIFTNVPPGTHTAYVQHTNGCTKQVPFTIDNLLPISATPNVTANVLCFGESTGSIEVTATGGTGTIEYAISPAFTYGTSNTFNNLPAGTYTIRVKDNIGCEVELTNITVTEPAAALSATVGGTHEICLGDNNGTITITPAGGTAPYYTSLDSNNPADFVMGQLSYPNLNGGQTYTVYVKDANGCEITPQTFTINNGVDIQPTATVVPNCTANVPGNTVTINVNPAVASQVQYSLDGVTYVTSNTFTNVAPGTHTAYVQHMNGCTKTVPFTINTLLPITASANVTADVLCFGQSTGSIQVTATGGTGTIEYAISPAFTYGTSNTFNNLAAGTYTIKVKDNIGCEVELTNIIVTQPAAALSATVGGTHEICLGDNNGTITITPTGGTAPYSTSLDSNNPADFTSTLNYTNLNGGQTYTVYVKDANGCEITPQTFMINVGVDIQPTATVVPNCTANVPGNTVTIGVNPALASQVQYSLDGVTYVSSNVFTNVAPGTHTAYVQHTNSCTKTVPFTINALLPITASANVTADVLCFGNSTGSIQVTATGGTGTIEYAISPAFVYGTANTFNNLAAGTYIVKVKDNIGCEVELTNIIVTQPAAVLSATVGGTHEICLGDNNGTITITPTGGTAPYSTSLDSNNPADFTSALNYTNLNGGQTYTVYVKDANGCEITPQTFTINVGVDIQPTATVVPNCTANVPGNTVTIGVNPAVASQVQYSLDGVTYVTSNTFTNVAPGTHTAYVQHMNGCTKTVPFTINALQPVVANANVTANVLCFGQSTGSIQVTATGGTGTIEYAISPAFAYGTANTFNNLPAGTYIVRVKDNIGCEVELTNITVTEPAAVLSATVGGTHEICLGDNNGTITITPAGGTAPYTTSLDSNNPADFTSTLNYTNLNGGQTYTVYVKDANGCEITPHTFMINVGVDIQPTATVVPNCTANVPGNTVTIGVNPAVASQVQYSLDGVTYVSSNVFTNVAPGTHTAYVQHTNSCTKTVPFTINALQPVVANASVTANVLCFGQSTGSIQVTATGGTGTIEYAISPAFVYGTANTFNNLPAGTYTIRVKDNIGCEITLTNITVTEPAAALSATVGGTHEICLGENNGTITITPAGGTAPYTTSLDSNNPADFTSTLNYINLNGGQTYTVYVKDANGCEITPQTFMINVGVDIQPTATVVANCTSNVPGNTVTIGVNPAVAAQVQYSLDGINYVASNTFTNLVPGNHTAYVKHLNGCVKPVTFTINALQPVAANANVTANVLCFGQSTGSIQVTATGGTGTIEYAISPAFVYGTANTFNNLPAGTYSIKVKDNIGCEITLTNITVTQPAAALSATVGGTHEICLGENNGTITITPAGGTAPYTTSLDSNNPADFTSTLTYTNLNGGQTYTIYVKDANGCQITPLTFIINRGVDIRPTAAVVPNCTNNVPGNTVTINVNPAVATQVQYSLDGINYVASNTFTNLAPGNHTAFVKHLNGCVKPVTFTINTLLPVAANANVTANVLCFGQSTGRIQVTASGGTGVYQYAISPAFGYTPSNTFNNLAAGTYSIKVKDVNGCEITLTNITVTQPATALTALVTGTPETCDGLDNGTITIVPSGGTAPYYTSLNSNNPANFTTTLNYTNLIGGRQYTVYVKDANGCQITPVVFRVNDGLNLQPTAVVTTNCNGNTPGNTVTVSVNPVVVNDVQYSLDGINYVNSNVFNNLPVGLHTIYVKHVNGCIKTTSARINAVTPITANATAVNATCNGLSNGRITITASGGTGPLQYGISPDFNLSSSNIFQNLAAGNYSVRAVDSKGCYKEVNIAVTEPNALQATVVDVFQEICVDDDNGAIEISVTGGTAPYSTSLSQNGTYVRNEFLYENLNGGQTYTIYVKDAKGCTTSVQVTLDAPVDIDADENIVYNCNGNTVTISVSPSVANNVTYSLDGGTPQTGNIFTDLTNGRHTVEVLHTSACTDTVSFFISNAVPVNVTLAETGLNKITATASGGTGNYTYTFNGYDNGRNNVYVFYQSGAYEVVVTDSNGCEARATINVVFVDITIPNVTTPNDDGDNDTWSPGNTQNYPNITTDIFDRYGRKVATLRQGQSWDGRYNGTELPSGDYWYLIKLGNPNDNREFVGNFTIYR